MPGTATLAASESVLVVRRENAEKEASIGASEKRGTEQEGPGRLFCLDTIFASAVIFIIQELYNLRFPVGSPPDLQPLN
jgi:hypothetical protein